MITLFDMGGEGGGVRWRGRSHGSSSSCSCQSVRFRWFVKSIVKLLNRIETVKSKRFFLTSTMI